MSAPKSKPDGQFAAARQLEACGLKPTLARMAIWQVLKDATEPLSIYDVQRILYEESPAISFNTLYPAFRQMEEKGIVRKLRVDGRNNQSYYALAGGGQYSQSLVCSVCGRQQWVDDAQVREAIEELCRKHGWELTTYQVQVHARCAGCSRGRRQAG